MSKKGILIIYNIVLGEQIEDMIKKCDIDEFTIFNNVIGKGTGGGARFNNDVYPGMNNALFIALDKKDKFEEFRKSVDEFKKKFKKDGITYFILPVE